MTIRETVKMLNPNNTKWEKIHPLGSGGQGSTFLARNKENPEEDKRVLKELNNPGDDQARRRFENEIEIIKGICHPSIIKIVDYSIWDNPPFYVMEYHEGARTLADVIITQDQHANPFYVGLSLSRLESRDSRAAKLVSQIVAEQVGMNAIDGFVEQGSVDLQ